MKRKNTNYLLAILLACFVLIANLGYTQVQDYNTLDRPYESRVVKGSGLTKFDGSPLEQLHLYAYHSETNSWKPIPFQFDELGADQYYSDGDGLLNERDELVFMVRDLGDRVTSDNWIDNIEAQNNQRYEIVVYNHPELTQKGWAYLYKSSTITEKSSTGYMNYDPQQDKVTSTYYEAGFNANGVLNDFVITTENGGNGIDILDRQKMRIGGLMGPGMEYEMNEDSIRKANIDYIAGPVRVIRRIRNNIIVAGDTLFKDLKITSRFYPFSMQYSGHATFYEQQGVGLVRQSWDFNENAVGMTFHSTNNRDIPVDGQADGALDDSLTHDALNWMMVTGNQGTVYAVNDLSFIGSSQRLYFWDNASGSTGDDTYDTGDNKSYGDMGLIIKGYRIKDILDFKTTVYFLPANQSPDIGEALQEEFADLLACDCYIHLPMALDDMTGKSIPQKFRFLQNHPNPFNSSTRLSFDLPQKSQVKLRIMNILGQTINTLVDEALTSGRHHCTWSGKDLRGNDVVSGVYFSVIEAGNYHAIRKLILIK